MTSPAAPVATVEIDLSARPAAREDYPRYVLSGKRTLTYRIRSRER